MRAAISSAGFPSDTLQLVDACLASVRSAAHLDDAAVLPPLPPLAPRRGVVVFTKSQTGLAAATPLAPLAPLAPFAPAAEAPPRSSRRWPIFLCAFVAGLAGGAALVVSPVGHRPEVQGVASSARARASGAVHATIALVSSLR